MAYGKVRVDQVQSSTRTVDVDSLATTAVATQSVAGLLSATDKTKLDGVAAGAEVNVNADWTASSGDAQILNKPTIGTVTTVSSSTAALTVATATTTPTLTVRSATTSVNGIVQLSDSTSTTSSILAATPTAVKAAYDLAAAALPKAGGTVTGDITLGTNVGLQFEGTTDDDNEIRLIGADATADRTITLPDVTGTVVTTGDSGTVTSTMIANGTIVNADISASAAIAGTKIAPNFGSQTITTTGVISPALGTAAAPSIAFTGDPNTGIYSPGADQLAVATNGVGRLFVDASGEVTTANGKFNSINIGLGAGSVSSNTAVGSFALRVNSTGSSNTAVGIQALFSVATGSSNTAVGHNALYGTTSNNNTAIGQACLQSNSSGGNNTAVGVQSLFGNSSGNGNTCYGYQAGYALTTGSNNTIIGNIQGTAGLADTVIIGAGATERLRIDSSARLLVGTSSDSGGALFQVNGDRIRVGTAKTPATSGATGTTGEIAWDADYIYVCTATNTWKRVAIATW